MPRLAFLAAAVLVCAVPHLAAQSTSSRSLYVSVLDTRGKPVPGMTAADVALKEDGRARPVLSLAPAGPRVSVVLLVDDSGLGLNDFRMGVARFMNRLLPSAEFSLVGIAEQNRLLAPFTSDGNALGQAVGGLRARNSTGSGHLVEGVAEGTVAIERREAQRRVVVILTNQAREYGNPDAEPVMERLVRTETALYVVETPRRGADNRGSMGGYDRMAEGAADNEAAEADRARNRILGDGPKETGGRREEVINPADVPAVLESIAADLVGQYLLVYDSAARAGATPRIAVATSQKGVRLRAPARSTDRKKVP